ncbi:MAG: hypothetical protein ACI845_000385 [Gammaproteobacteria bacterium]|jgi:hypothetical protein
MKHIGLDEIHRMGESATAAISALRARLSMLKKRLGLAIPLFFSYVKRARKTNLKAIQLRFPG